MANVPGVALLANAVGALGALALLACVAWRFGPTLLRVVGFCSWGTAWACGTQGGYAYCAAFAIFGTLAWGLGSVWSASRRGRWPSTLSERILSRVLGRRSPLARPSASTVPTGSLRSP